MDIEDVQKRVRGPWQGPEIWTTHGRWSDGPINLSYRLQPGGIATVHIYGKSGEESIRERWDATADGELAALDKLLAERAEDIRGLVGTIHTEGADTTHP